MDLSFITDEAQRAKIAEAVTGAIDEATEGLKAKNSELLGKLKKAQKGADIDPAEYQQLAEANQKLTDDLNEARKTLKKMETENGNLKKSYESESSFARRMLIDNSLNESMMNAKVKPEMMEAVKALLSGQVNIKVDGDNRVAMLGDKPLNDAVSEWAKSDKGKHFVAAPENQGGGANGGSNGNGSAKLMDRTAFEGLPPAKQMAFIKDGGKVQSVQ